MKKNKDERRLHTGEETKKYETSDERRSAKRVAQLQKQTARREARVVKYGSDSVGALALHYNKRLIAAFVALVMVISCMAVGFGIITRAEDYNAEDKPVNFQILINDELYPSDGTDFSVQFPTALIEEGNISKGIEFQKVSDDGSIIVDSIQNIIDKELFGNQDALEDKEKKHADYLAAYLAKENGTADEITNIYVDDEENTYCYFASSDGNEIADLSNWTLVDDTDRLYLTFANDNEVAEVVNASEKNILVADTEAEATVNEDGTIPEVNGVLPTTVKGLFKSSSLKASAKVASHLEAVDFDVLYNDTPLTDGTTITVPAGHVETNMAKSSVTSQEESKLHAKATWKKAVVWKLDTTENVYLSYEVLNVGKYEDSIYYSLEGNDEDTGILLGENDKLYLQYELIFDVSYVLTPEEGGNVVGSTTTVKYGKSLPVAVNANTYYQISSLKYNIVTGYDSNGSASSYKHGVAQNVTNQTIPSSEIIGDVIIYAEFTKDTQYYIDGDGITHGHICATHSLEYSNSNDGDDIAEYGDTDSSSGIKHGVTVSAGGTAYLVMFAQKSTSSTDAYFLNAIWLNDEEVKVPTTYSYTAGDSSCVATTTLSNGSIVTVSLVSDSNDSHISGNSSTSRLRYIIKITEVKENTKIEVYFRPYAKTHVYLKGLRGIANTAASYPVPTYQLWTSTRGDQGAAHNTLYFLDENNTDKMIGHMYTSYNKDKLKEQISNDQHLDTAVLILGHQLNHFHYHNVFLAKVKPGYNANHITYTDLLCNYMDGSSTLNQAKNITISNSTTDLSFQSAYDEKDSTSYWLGYTHTEDYYYCHWDTLLTSSNVATLSVGQNGRYSVLTNEVSNDSYFDTGTNTAVTYYTPFLSGAKKQHYYTGIMLPELTYYNNSLEVNSFAYKYKIQYFVNGIDQNGNSVSSTYNDIDTSTHEFESGNATFKEINRHAVEIAANQSSSADANEFDGVVTDDVVIPEEPEAIDNDNYKYSFLYWKLVKCNASTGAYVSDVKDSSGKIIKYTPGETFSLTNAAVGSYTAPASTLTGYNISLADYAVTSGEASSGYAWGDYTSSNDEALTFTFMPVWNATPIGDYLNYSVLAYKDTPDGALTDSNGDAITDIQNGKTYYLYYKNTDNKAAPSSSIVSLDQHYPTDGKTYDMNEDLTDEKIDSLTSGTDDTIVYYYDVSEYAVTITELTQPKAGDPDYTSKDKAFTILLTLMKDDGTAAEAGIYGDVEFTTADGSTTATLSLTNGQSKALSIPDGYKLTVTEDADSRTCSAGTYEVTYSEDDGTTSSDSYTNRAVNNSKTITVINTLAAPDIASGILNTNNPFGILLSILAGICAVAAGGTLYYTKRKKEDGTE